MQKSSSHEEMLWYIDQTYKNKWGRSMVLNQIAMKAYERSLIEHTTTNIVNASSEEENLEIGTEILPVNVITNSNYKNIVKKII